MRRTARVLSVAVLAGTALGGAAAGVRAEAGAGAEIRAEPGSGPGAAGPAVASSPDAPVTRRAAHLAVRPGERPGDGPGRPPTAEVSPSAVRPGGSVTVAVSCGPGGGPAPKSIEATSEAFAGGTADLHRVPGGDHASGPAYRGTARIAPAGGLGTGPGEREAPDDPGPGGDLGDPPGADQPGADPHGPAPGDGHPAATGPPAPGPDGGRAPDGRDLDGRGPAAAGPPPGASRRTVHGTCPAPPGARGRAWSAAFTVTHGGGTPTAPPDGHHCPPTRTGGGGPCDGAVAHRGVHAGAGGAFTDSVPALVAGGLFIAAALCGAAYRLRPGRPAGGR